MRSIVLAACLLATTFSLALADGVVAIGDKAPALSYDAWIKGARVTRFAPGTVYLVEFWGTWCPPCLESIPHLSNLQKRHTKDGLVVLGVASHEFKGRPALAKFMRERGDRIGYRVAFDADQSMEHDWDTGGRDSVRFRMPLCFVVDRIGKVAFVGHPAEAGLDSTLDAVLARR